MEWLEVKPHERSQGRRGTLVAVVVNLGLSVWFMFGSYGTDATQGIRDDLWSQWGIGTGVLTTGAGLLLMRSPKWRLFGIGLIRGVAVAFALVLGGILIALYLVPPD